MIDLEVPQKFEPLIEQAHMAALHVFRPISRKYDLAEHQYPEELDMLAELIDGRSAEESNGAGAAGASQAKSNGDGGNRNGSNMASVLSILEMCWGDVGLLLTMPRQGLGNSAIAAVADDEQKARFKGKWAAMAITCLLYTSDAADE